MKVLGASVLALEAIVVILAIPVALVVGPVPAPTWLVVTGGIVLAIALIIVARYVTQPWGITAGWILQALVILTGFLARPMFVVGAIFALLWLVAIRLAQRVEDGSG